MDKQKIFYFLITPAHLWILLIGLLMNIGVHTILELSMDDEE